MSCVVLGRSAPLRHCVFAVKRKNSNTLHYIQVHQYPIPQTPYLIQVPTPHIILFDGVCNLCNASVQFVLKRDRKKQFRFASLQGKFGQEVLRKHQLPVNTFNSFILLEGDKIYCRSTGALRMLKYLGAPWSLMYIFILVPAVIRDGVYNWISQNRYKWFGKKESCWLPKPEWKELFID